MDMQLSFVITPVGLAYFNETFALTFVRFYYLTCCYELVR